MDPLQRISALFSPLQKFPLQSPWLVSDSSSIQGDQWPLAGRTWHHVLVMTEMITPGVKMQGFVLVLSFSDCTFDLLTWHNYEFSHLGEMESERSQRALFKRKHRLSAKVSNLAPCGKPRAVPELKCCCLSAVSHIILTLATSHFIWL